MRRASQRWIDRLFLSSRQYFIPIANSNRSFLDLSFEQLCQFLANDDLNIRNEENLFDACIKWIDHDSETRKSVCHSCSTRTDRISGSRSSLVHRATPWQSTPGIDSVAAVHGQGGTASVHQRQRVVQIDDRRHAPIALQVRQRWIDRKRTTTFSLLDILAFRMPISTVPSFVHGIHMKSFLSLADGLEEMQRTGSRPTMFEPINGPLFHQSKVDFSSSSSIWHSSSQFRHAPITDA